MKKHLSFVFALCFAIASANLSAQEISAGVRVGANFAAASMSIPNVSSTSGSTTQFVASIPLELRFSPSFALQPELSYLGKGGVLNATNSSAGIPVSLESTQTFNYLDLPILAKYGFNFSGLQLDLLAGPRFGYMLGGKTKTTGSILGISNTEEKTLTADDLKETNRFETGVDFGVALQYPVGDFNLVFDARYMLGFTNIVKDAANGTFKNRGVALSIGIMKAFAEK